MGQTLLITELTKNNKSFLATALFEEKHLLEVNLEICGQESILGNIYVGRVKDVVKNLNAAFIEITPGCPCYYSLEDCCNPLYVKKINSPRMVQGDEVVVQVIKENSKTKPPKVSTNLNLTGRYLVLTTENTALGISKKLDSQSKDRLKQALMPYANSEYGLIVRTNAAQVELPDILTEYQQLRQEYLHIKETACHRTCFSCLKESRPAYLDVLQSLDLSTVESIITDSPKLYQLVYSYLTAWHKTALEKLTLYEDTMLSLNKLYSLDARLDEALKERVWLKSGAYLVIQPTEALTVIDVNTGKSIAKKQVQEHYLKVNLEAAKEIAHQLRLRNISGIIMIDFIDLASSEAKLELMQCMRRETRGDRVPVQVVDMTKLHLVELTRKRVKKSLAEQFNPQK